MIKRSEIQGEGDLAGDMHQSGVDCQISNPIYGRTGNRAFVARELAPAGLRSGPKTFHAVTQNPRPPSFAAASHPSGSKLPRHMDRLFLRVVKTL